MTTASWNNKAPQHQCYMALSTFSSAAQISGVFTQGPSLGKEKDELLELMSFERKIECRVRRKENYQIPLSEILCLQTEVSRLTAVS